MKFTYVDTTLHIKIAAPSLQLMVYSRDNDDVNVINKCVPFVFSTRQAQCSAVDKTLLRPACLRAFA